MFGSYKFGKSVKLDSIEIETYEDSGLYIYRRSGNATKVMSIASDLTIHPVEPVTQPKEVTHYLLIELKDPVVVAPAKNHTFYVTFPLEISVYVSIRRIVEQVDSFTFTNPKYTLYGTPEKGIICKWWESNIYSKIPDVQPHLEGVMKVNIQNTSHNWATLTKVVFDAYYMKIYYKDIACMNALVKIDNNTARTSFVEEPIVSGMKKAIELFRLRKIPIVDKAEFLMERGL